jgi:hypothetical protein
MLPIIIEIIKGIFLAILYFEITQANDSTIYNVSLFTFFYTILVTSSDIIGIQPSIVLNAFMTKTVFTLIDQRINKQDPQVITK